MPITAVEPPVRTRNRESMWGEDDVKAAADLLAQGKAAKHGEYEGDTEDRALSVARSAGYSLARAIEAHNGAKWRVSAWMNENGKAIGALLPKARIQRNVMPQQQPQGKGKGGK